MQWHRVVIPNDENAAFAAACLLNGFVGECIEAGSPEDAAVYRGRTALGEQVFYFSPVAASIATDLLADYGAIVCADEPDLTDFTRLPM